MIAARNVSEAALAAAIPPGSELQNSVDELPVEPLSPEFQPHFDGLANHEIRLPCCGECGRFHWYPMPLCPHCRSGDIQWTRVAGNATLYSWTIVRHAFQPSLRGELPYFVALVTFDDAPGVRLITNLVNVASTDLQLGMAMRPVFDNPPDALPKVQFCPA